MLIKLFTITLFLFSATVFAEVNTHQNSDIDTLFKQVLLDHQDPNSLDSTSEFAGASSSEKVVAYEAAVKFFSYTEGFFKGIDSLDIFTETISCLDTSMKLVEDLENSVKDLASQDPAKVNDAIVTIGHVTQVILNAVNSCKPAGADLKALIKLVDTFKSPYSFIFTQGRSLLVNNVEIIFEAAHILEAYNNKDFSELGFWVGKAMDSIVKDLNKKLRPEYAEFLNNVNQWQATVPKKFENMTFEEIKNRYLGSQPIDYSRLGNLTEFNYEGLIQDVPDYFNSSEQWPGCVHPIRDQGQCGSCWAFAASEVLSDRFCVASNGSVQVVLSPQYLLSCDKPLSLGCNGGVPLFSWWFIINQGLVTDECLPYLSYNGTNPLKCDDFKTCEDGSQIKKYYGVNESTVVLHNPPSIQANMMQYGPVDAAMIVYEDFMYYAGGVYKHTTGKIVGLHSVKLTGWGTENGENYWIVANSWGATWGENGFFRIAFGQCGIDEATATGRADLSRLPTMSENRFW